MNYEEMWNQLKEYVDGAMEKNRRFNGKFDKKNRALWEVKTKMKVLDPSVSFVGETFNEHEHSDFDVK